MESSHMIVQVPAIQTRLDYFTDPTFAPVLIQFNRFRATLFQPGLVPWNSGHMAILDSEISTLLSDIRQRRNDVGVDSRVTGAHSLPDELISKVFDFLVNFRDPDRYTFFVKSILSLLRVSKRWARIASGTPRLWRGIDFTIIPQDYIYSWLDRCGTTTPLSIWSSSADVIIRIRDKYPHFPAQVSRLTLLEQWYHSSVHKELITSSTFPNIVSLRIHYYPRPDHTFVPPSLAGFKQLHTLNIGCTYEFWAADGSLPASIEDLTIRLYGSDEVSVTKLARALGSLARLRRLDLHTTALFFSEGGDRMQLPFLECVHLISNPHHHHHLLDILPTFQSRPYHLIARASRDDVYFDGPTEFASSLGVILQCFTSSFTRVRFILGSDYPVMKLEGPDHLSVNIEQHNHDAKYLSHVLRLLDLSCIEEAILTEERSDRPSFYYLPDVYDLLRSVQRLVIERGVGPEASRLLVGLGGKGRRFLFPRDSYYTVHWPCLSSIHFYNIHSGFFYLPDGDAIRSLGLAIWSIKSSGIPLHNIHISKTTRNIQEFMQWREFVPTVIVEEDSDEEMCQDSYSEVHTESSE